MADISKGIPVRTEDDADQKVQVKVVDSTTTSQQMTVDTDGNAHVQVHGDNPAGGDEVLRLSELGAPNPDGDYDVTNNTKPASMGMIAHSRSATKNETQSNERPTAVQGEGDSTCLDISLHDGAGNLYDDDNPLPTYVTEDPADEIHDFNEAVDIAAAGTATHTYSVASGRTLLLDQVLGDASSRFKMELEIGDGGAVEVFTTKAVRFQSEDNGKAADIDFKTPIKVVGTANTTTVRLTLTNRDDDDAQSVYTTIVGRERNT